MLNELLGFVVLTGPLFFIVLWIPVCIILAIWVSRKAIKKSMPAKIIGGLLVFFILLLLPVVDEIAGRVYLNHLCETQAGAKVYKKMELSAEYWDKQGIPKFLKENGDIDRKLLDEKIDESRELESYLSFPPIEMYRYKVKNNSNEILGERIDFLFSGGWVIRSTTSSNSAITCKKSRGKEFWRDFYSSIFVPEGSNTLE